LHGDAQDVELRRAFVAFWRVCNTEGATEGDVLKSFDELLSQPAFDRVIDRMVGSAKSGPEKA
jgi:hypothetical protein